MVKSQNTVEKSFQVKKTWNVWDKKCKIIERSSKSIRRNKCEKIGKFTKRKSANLQVKQFFCKANLSLNKIGRNWKWKKKVSNVWERNIDKQFFEKKLKHLCERENIFKKSEICCSFLIKNFSDEDFKTGSLHYCLIAGVWLGFGGSGCLHQRLWEESSEPRLIVDWKTGSAAEPTLHSVQAQSRHAQKQRW